MKCIFGCRNAVAIYILPKGCVCKREIVQPLCAQHEHKCSPLGRMVLVTRFYDNGGDRNTSGIHQGHGAKSGKGINTETSHRFGLEAGKAGEPKETSPAPGTGYLIN
jgi:hypothetical protein